MHSERTPAETPSEKRSAPDMRCSSWCGGTNVAARASPSAPSGSGGPAVVAAAMRAAMGIATGTDVPCSAVVVSISAGKKSGDEPVWFSYTALS